MFAPKNARWPEDNWKPMALQCLNALRLLDAHYDDLSKSNPGFMGRLCLQDYGLWNEALLSSSAVLKKYEDIKTRDLNSKEEK